MTHPALTSAAKPRRADEATGTRLKQKVSENLPPPSPNVFARRLLDAGRAREALDILDSEIVGGNESAELQFWVGRAAFSLGDYVRAQRALCRSIALAPNDAHTHRLLARVLLRRGNVVGAMRILRQSSQSSRPPKLALAPSSAQAMGLDFDQQDSEEPPTTEWTR